MSEANIRLTDPAAVLSLFGPQDQYLKLIRNHFGVAITHRDGKLKIIGEADAVRHATNLMEDLHQRAQQSGGLTRQEVEGALGNIDAHLKQRSVDAADLDHSDFDSELASDRVRGDSGASIALHGTDWNRGNEISEVGRDLSGSDGSGQPPNGSGQVSNGSGQAAEKKRSSRSRNGGNSGRLGDSVEAAVHLPHQQRKIRPRSDGQAAYLSAVRKNDLTLCRGPAGCGKTYLAVALAVEALKTRKIRKIVLVRPAVEAGESLGFLPGDLQAKLNPYLRPLLDALNEMLDYDQVKYLMEHDVIEVIPLAYMRGRTLNEAFIILDEAQNTTSAQMKMFLTRMGDGSKIVVTGDVTQVDLPSGVHSGLRDAWHRLGGIPGISFVTLDAADIVRHQLVQQIVGRYESQGGGRSAMSGTAIAGATIEPSSGNAAGGSQSGPQDGDTLQRGLSGEGLLGDHSSWDPDVHTDEHKDGEQNSPD